MQNEPRKDESPGDLETLPITLWPDELPTYRAAVIACASAGDRDSCERLLGQIASLEAIVSNGSCVAFLPSSRTAGLAYRALMAMRRETRRNANWKSRPALHRLTGERPSSS